MGAIAARASGTYNPRSSSGPHGHSAGAVPSAAAHISIPLPVIAPDARVGGGGSELKKSDLTGLNGRALGAADETDSELGSEGGKSEASGGSAMSSVAGGPGGGGHAADYKRGKRYRKLARLLDSPQAQQVK